MCILKLFRRRRAVRLVPMFGPFSDTVGPVKKTPQFYSFPLLGEVMAVTFMTTDQQFTFTIKPVDKHGNPAKVDGVPVWLTDNTDVLALTPSDDGLSCLVKAVGITGSGKVQVTADALIGEGTESLVGIGEVGVKPLQATAIELVPSTPEDQPTP